MGDVDTLADTFRETGAAISGPSVQVMNKGKLAKPKGVTARVTRKQVRNDLVQAGTPRSEIEGITTSEMFHRWQKSAFMQEKLTTPIPTPALCPPSALPGTSTQDATWQQKRYTFQLLPQGCKHSPSICHQMIAADVALWSGTDTV